MSLTLLKQSEENLHFLHLQNLPAFGSSFAAFLHCELIAFASSEEIYLCISTCQLLKSRFLHMYPSPHAPSSGFLLLHHCYKHTNMLKYLPFLLPIYFTVVLYRNESFILSISTFLLPFSWTIPVSFHPITSISAYRNFSVKVKSYHHVTKAFGQLSELL